VIPGASRFPFKNGPCLRPAHALMIRSWLPTLPVVHGTIRQRARAVGSPHGPDQRISLKTPNAGPHGLAADKDGNIWYTSNFKAHIGKLNPTTGDVTEYPMPDPAARDPHTPSSITRYLWFTVQGGNMVGRLIPQTGEVTLVASPTPKSRPTAWWSIPRAFPSSSSRQPQDRQHDPHTMEIREYELPNAETRPRASLLPAMTCSGTPTMPAATWGGSILPPARPASGPLRAGPSRNHTGFTRFGMSCGTAKLG